MGFSLEVSHSNLSINYIPTIRSDRSYHSVPAGFVAFLFVFLAMPRRFPHISGHQDRLRTAPNVQAIKRVDFIGAFLLLAASILLISALEEGGIEYSWASSVVLSLLSLSVILWIVFLCWERHLGSRQSAQEPVLPWRLLNDRFVMSFLLYVIFNL